METAHSISLLEYTTDKREQFSELLFHLRDDVSKVKDPRAKTLFKVSAKVIARLQKAFMEYEERIKRGSMKNSLMTA